MIEVLLLHRRLPAEAVITGITTALQAGATSPDLVAIEARKAATSTARSQPLLDERDLSDLGLDTTVIPVITDDMPDPRTQTTSAPVISLHTRRELPASTSPLPSVAIYDQLPVPPLERHLGMTATLPAPTTTAPVAVVAPGVDSIDALIDQACRTLRLPTIGSRFEQLAATALRDQASYKEFLLTLLDAECEHRDERRKIRRVREANFPRPKRLDDFDYTANPNVVPEVVNTLATPRLGQRRATALPDRPIRHRQVPSAHRHRHRDRRGRALGPLHHHREPGQRAGRSRRRPATDPRTQPLQQGRPALPG